MERRLRKLHIAPGSRVHHAERAQMIRRILPVDRSFRNCPGKPCFCVYSCLAHNHSCNRFTRPPEGLRSSSRLCTARLPVCSGKGRSPLWDLYEALGMSLFAQLLFGDVYSSMRFGSSGSCLGAVFLIFHRNRGRPMRAIQLPVGKTLNTHCRPIDVRLGCRRRNRGAFLFLPPWLGSGYVTLIAG
jgi:hypothetical protein